MTWFKCDPTDFWNQHEVQALTIEGVGFLWWLCGRSWTTGPIRDDPAFYRRQAFSRARDFDALWKEVRSVLEVRDGHLFFPWFDGRRTDTQTALEKDKARKALARAPRPTESDGVQRNPAESDGIHLRREEIREDEKREDEKRPDNPPTPLEGGVPAKPARAKKPLAPVPELNALPPSLRTRDFHDALGEFFEFRATEKRDPITPIALRNLLREMEGHGSAPGAAALRQSMANGWKGVFPAKCASGAPRAPQPMAGGMREFFERGQVFDVTGGGL